MLIYDVIREKKQRFEVIRGVHVFISEVYSLRTTREPVDPKGKESGIGKSLLSILNSIENSLINTDDP